LERAGVDWLIAVYETYLDDSGTNAQSEIAIAAAYVSTEPGWRKFCREWDEARLSEGFDFFHMAEFVAPREQGHKPWCDWDNSKKDRVYERLARIINENKRIGVGVAIPKKLYDSVPQRIRDHYGNEHYTFAVRMCIMQIAEWRAKSAISLPMQYIFDWEKPGTPKHQEISSLMTNVHEKLMPYFGLDTGGYSFQTKRTFEPLQAADILAWQVNNYMPKIYPEGEFNFDKCHKGFKLLRLDQEMNIGFFSESNINDWLKRIETIEAEHGIII
jgi:hypothetical protein